MKPKNNKERRNSILKFALLFLITVSIIVVALFFDFDRLPLKENELLRERKAMAEKEMEYQEEFSGSMEEIKALIDSLDVPGQNILYISQLVNSKIVDLQRTIPVEDSTYRYDMYNNIINSYLELKEMKTKLTEYGEVDKRLKEYEEELDRVREELNIANRNLDAYRLSN